MKEDSADVTEAGFGRRTQSHHWAVGGGKGRAVWRRDEGEIERRFSGIPGFCKPAPWAGWSGRASYFIIQCIESLGTRGGRSQMGLIKVLRHCVVSPGPRPR